MENEVINTTTNPTFEEEVSIYLSKAEAGDVDAMYNLGRVYGEEAYKRKSKKLMKQSYHYFKMAADEGDIESYAHLGMMAAEGEGTRKNDADAKFYLEKYIQQREDDGLEGLLGACYFYLGQLYVVGQGTKRNVPKGYAYVLKAIELGGEGTEGAEEYLAALKDAYPFTDDGSIDLSVRGRTGLTTLFLLIGVLGCIFGFSMPILTPETKETISVNGFYIGMTINILAYLGVMFWQKWAGWLMVAKLIFCPVAAYLSLPAFYASMDNGVYMGSLTDVQSFCLAFVFDGLLVLAILLLLQRSKKGHAAPWCSLLDVEDDGRNAFTRFKDIIMVYGEGDDYRMHSIASKTFITCCYVATAVVACVALYTGWKFIVADIDWGMDIEWKCWKSPHLWGFLSFIGFFAQFFDWRHLSFREGWLVKEPGGKKKFVPDDDILSVLFGTVLWPIIGHLFLAPMMFGAIFYYIIMGALALLGASVPYVVAVLCLASAWLFFKNCKHLYPRRWRVPLLVVLTCAYAAFLFIVSTIPADGSKMSTDQLRQEMNSTTLSTTSDEQESGVLGDDIQIEAEEEPDFLLEEDEDPGCEPDEPDYEMTNEEAVPDSLLTDN